jgi:thiamine-phosphate pyrophosphorylase
MRFSEIQARRDRQEKMPLNLQAPITYLITGGETTAATAPSSEEFLRILKLIEAASAAGISLVQLREKNLSALVTYELARRAAAITRGSDLRLVVNDRADIARAAGADGVHLTTRSIPAATIRRTFGTDFLIGVSTHSLAEARAARDGDADFAVFGPVFDTVSKRVYGDLVGLDELRGVARELAPFPVLALGGINLDNAHQCLRAGASGIAGISLFSEARCLAATVRELRNAILD